MIKKDRRELTKEERIDQSWKILKERDEKLIEQYLKLMRDRDKRKQKTKAKMVDPRNGRWQGRTVFDLEGKATGRIGYSSRDLRLKRPL